MTDPTQTSQSDLVKTFQILDNVAAVLTMVLSGAEASAVSSSVAKIHSKFQECEALLDNLPGGDMSKIEQNRKIEELTASIAQKKALVAKYGNLDLLRQIALSTSGPTEPAPQNAISVSPSYQNHAAQSLDFASHLNHRQGTNMQTSLMGANADHVFFGAPHVSQTELMPSSGSLNVSNRNLGDKGLDPMEL